MLVIVLKASTGRPPRRDGFRHGAHAHGVRAPLAQHADFGGSLEMGSGHVGVHAALQADAHAARRVPGQIGQPGCVGVIQGRKPIAEIIQVGAA